MPGRSMFDHLRQIKATDDSDARILVPTILVIFN